jgi:hypothetical protein
MLTTDRKRDADEQQSDFLVVFETRRVSGTIWRAIPRPLRESPRVD